MRQQPWQQEAAARGGRCGSKARRRLLLTRARTVGIRVCHDAGRAGAAGGRGVCVVAGEAGGGAGGGGAVADENERVNVKVQVTMASS